VSKPRLILTTSVSVHAALPTIVGGHRMHFALKFLLIWGRFP
jgi:hypothetical protein